jgi:hypothetical protein
MHFGVMQQQRKLMSNLIKIRSTNQITRSAREGEVEVVGEEGEVVGIS